ncbi:MAG TPA: polysaccharide biosynthesis protein [Pyrinomonadaceae bacterium]|nr:polysaccharide biosynthesis protein [Pyrinomonadaceae bacterium]
MEKIESLKGKKILVTGGTGSLGKTLVRRLLTGEKGLPERITVFSRDEAKQHYMRLDLQNRSVATDEVIYHEAEDILDFTIGDVRDLGAVSAALRDTDIVFHAAALKQVPSCEYFPFEAVQTNIGGAQNVVRAIRENGHKIEAVVGISTDKACKPINVMGMTKALQERVFVEANRRLPDTRFVCVRYGNVIASRGSIVPLFAEQIRNRRPLTVTLPEMTRFLLSLDRAVDTVFAVLEAGRTGETFVPQVPSAKIIDLARAMMGEEELPINFTGIRPGEKIHEIMVSEEECFRTRSEGEYFAIQPVLPELRSDIDTEPALSEEYSSKNNNLTVEQLRELLAASSAEIHRFASV